MTWGQGTFYIWFLQLAYSAFFHSKFPPISYSSPQSTHPPQQWFCLHFLIGWQLCDWARQCAHTFSQCKAKDPEHIKHSLFVCWIHLSWKWKQRPPWKARNLTLVNTLGPSRFHGPKKCINLGLPFYKSYNEITCSLSCWPPICSKTLLREYATGKPQLRCQHNRDFLKVSYMPAFVQVLKDTMKNKVQTLYLMTSQSSRGERPIYT